MWLQDALEGLANKIYGIENTPATFQDLSSTLGSGLDSGWCYAAYDDITGMVTLTMCVRDAANISVTKTLFTLPAELTPTNTGKGACVYWTSSDGPFTGYATARTDGLVRQAASNNARVVYATISYSVR